MPSIRQSIRSSTASKRPTSAIADGQIALNTASGTPGLFFKDNAGNIIKAGPAHYGASAPNSAPATGGSTGNSFGEAWLDSSLTPAGWKVWNGAAWVNATPLSSSTVQGLVELATNAETQAGVDTARAVTAASLQSKVSDSVSTASASGIASSAAVKTAYDLANAALPKSGGIITGNLEIGSTGSFTFEGATADGFETTLAVVDPTADRTITFPNTTGTVVTTGDSGTVTTSMIADGTIVNADISTTAAIAFSKLASLSSANILVGDASGVPTATAVTGDVTITNSGVTAIASNVIVNADINSAAAITYSKLALSSGITNTDISASAAVAYSKLALSNSIINADIASAAAIVDTKLATIATAGKVSNSATTATSGNTPNAIVARDASGNFTAGTITATLSGNASTVTTNANLTGDVTSVGNATTIAAGVIVNADINAAAAIAGSKIVAATTSVVGAVQLSDSTSTTSSVLAATPTAVKAAYDLANAALPKAGGTLTGNVNLDNQVDARFYEATANGTNYVGFQAPASIAADVLWTLPATDGTAAQVLSTNGSGTLSWASLAGGTSISVGNTSATVTDTGTDGAFTVVTEGGTRLVIDSNGFAAYTGAIGRGAPVTKTGNFTLGVAENWIICNSASIITVTLPAASSWTGREVSFKTILSGLVSASSNVVPLAGGAAGTAILGASPGRHATLVSDGTNWVIMNAGSTN